MVSGSATDVCFAGMHKVQLRCFCPCCGDSNHIQGVFIPHLTSWPIRPFLTKAIPTLASAGNGAVKVDATLPQLAQAQVMVASLLSLQFLVLSCKQQQAEKHSLYY